MLKQLFEEQRQSLNRFLDAVDLEASQALLQKLIDCKGVVIFSGVGKSGHIAEKVAHTFSATGTRSSYLSTGNALHGDIGFVTPQDLWIAFSKSGASEELVQLLPHIKKRGAFTVAVVSKAQSKLAEQADLSVLLPVDRELCPYNLAPTTSTAAQLIFGDCLAVALMKAKQFSIEAFASNHPAGLIGRKISMTVADVMLKDNALPLSSPRETLLQMLHELSAKRCGCLLVVDEKKTLLGIFTDGDLRRALQNQGAQVLQAHLGDLIKKDPRTISPHHLALEAIQKMEENPASPITVLPVVEEGRVVGLVRMHDILQGIK
jgi:arabinose-5-phosphate isomerase